MPAGVDHAGIPRVAGKFRDKGLPGWSRQFAVMGKMVEIAYALSAFGPDLHERSPSVPGSSCIAGIIARARNRHPAPPD